MVEVEIVSESEAIEEYFADFVDFAVFAVFAEIVEFAVFEKFAEFFVFAGLMVDFDFFESVVETEVAITDFFFLMNY